MKPKPRDKGKEAEFARRQSAENETHDDWSTVCRKCGRTRTGRLRDLRVPHVCEEVTNGS